MGVTDFYVQGETQEVIANRLGVSRVRVGRLLKRAQAEGIVNVRVRQHPAVSAEIEQDLRRRFGLERALITLDNADQDVQRSAVASLVADHPSRSLTDGQIVAVGMGRNVGAVADSREPAVESAIIACFHYPLRWCCGRTWLLVPYGCANWSTYYAE